jgi:thiamine kinase-like enzyme
MLCLQIEVTKKECDAVESPVVFSHNDLLSGNILVLESSGDGDHVIGSSHGHAGNLQFIDFEYAAPGYR